MLDSPVGLLNSLLQLGTVAAIYTIWVESRKNRLELFDKRLKNYEAMNEIISKEKSRLDACDVYLADLALSDEFKERFAEEVKRTRFLFDEDVAQNRLDYRHEMDTYVGSTNESKTKQVGGPETVHFVYGYRGASGASMTMGRLDYEWEKLIHSYLRLGNPWRRRAWEFLVIKSRPVEFFFRHDIPYKLRTWKEKRQKAQEPNTTP